MSLVVESGDSDLDARVKKLIERGLTAYGGGDLEGAMSAWKHALTLDGDNRRAADYVAYVKRHFDIVDEQALDQEVFAAAEVELEIPFGLVTVRPHDEKGIEAYESFELARPGALPDELPFEEFAEEIPTRVRSGVSAVEIDEGWSLPDDSAADGPVPPLASHGSDLESLTAENALDPSLDPSLDLSLDPALVGALAAVSDELADLDSDLDVELEITRPLGDDEREATNKSTMLGFPEPPEPAVAVPLDVGSQTAEVTPASLVENTRETADLPAPIDDPGSRQTAELSPSALGVALQALELDDDDDDDLELEIIPPSSDALDLELGVAGPGLDFGTAATSELELGAVIGGDPHARQVIRPGSLSDVEFDLDPTPRPQMPPERPASAGVGGAGGLGPAGFGDAGPVLGPAGAAVTPRGGPPRGGPPLGGAPLGGAADNDDNDDNDDYAEVEVERSVGDAKISFRAPDASAKTSSPGSAELEAQLAELELELSGDDGQVQWTAHEGSKPTRMSNHDSGVFEPPVPSLPQLAPLEPRKPRTVSASPSGQRAGVPRAGLESVRAAIAATVESEARGGESADERTRRRIAALIACAENEINRNELASAAVAADMALEESPNSALGQKLVHERSELLVSVFRRFLGDQAAVVAVALPLHELAKHELDHRTAFLLSRVDGTLTIEDVLDVSGMARLEAFRALTRLVLQGILEVR